MEHDITPERPFVVTIRGYAMSWLALWEAHEHWLGGDFAGFKDELDLLADQLPTMEGSDRPALALMLGWNYRALGQFRRALEVDFPGIVDTSEASIEAA